MRSIAQVRRRRSFEIILELSKGLEEEPSSLQEIIEAIPAERFRAELAGPLKRSLMPNNYGPSVTTLPPHAVSY